MITENDNRESCDLLHQSTPPESFTLVLSGETAEVDDVLHCSQPLRWLPGKRLVCLAHWQGQDVIAKIYFCSRTAKRDWRKEVCGLDALCRHQIPAPRILYKGSTPRGIWVVLLQPVASARSLLDVWGNCNHESEKIILLANLIRVLAKHHEAGIVQCDVHFENFLLSGTEIFTLDGGGVKIFKRPLSMRRVLANLGLFFAQLTPNNDYLISDVFSVYARQRHLINQEKRYPLLVKAVNRHRRLRAKKYLKKIFRQCTEFICRKNLRRYTVFRRDYSSRELDEIIACPEKSLSFPETRFLKKGNSSTVWLTHVGGHSLVIKRYNIKGWLHGIKLALSRSRAAKSWRNAHMLHLYGILTPCPVAMIEERFGLFRGRAYFITEHLEGTDAFHLFSNLQTLSEKSKEQAGEIINLLELLRKMKIVHGDMKGTNIIMSSTGPALIDLDSLRIHKMRFFFKSGHERDIRRLLKNWQDNQKFTQFFNSLLKDVL